MSTAENRLANRLPRHQQGLLGLLAGVLIVLLLLVGVLVVDMQRLHVVADELARGMAACEPQAPEPPQRRDSDPRWLQEAQEVRTGGAGSPGDAAPRSGVERLRRAVLDAGVSVGCFVKKQMASGGAHPLVALLPAVGLHRPLARGASAGERRRADLAESAFRFASRRALPGAPRFQ